MKPVAGPLLRAVPVAAAAAPPAWSCLDCPQRRECVPGGLDDSDCALLDQLVTRRLTLKQGEHLYWMDQPVAHNLYAIRAGHYKLYQMAAPGVQRVAGFLADGELLGLDEIGAQRHRCSAVALTDSVLCEFSYPQLVRLLRARGQLPQLDRLLSRMLVREQWGTLLVRDGKGSQKMAGFLLARVLRHGGQPDLPLPMTRQDIGDYLGLMPETVSRLLQQFQRAGYISVKLRQLQVLDLPALRRIADGGRPRPLKVARLIPG